MKPAADMSGKEMNLSQESLLVGPQELVRLDAPQHVEFGGAFLDGGANGERHDDEADAVRGVPVVEAVLIEIEAVAIVERVHHRRDRAIETQRVQPKPAGLERPPRGIVVECAERRRVEWRGA